MKKIIVLTMLVLLAIGMPVVAVDFGGDFNIEAGSNFKEGYAPKFDFSLDVSQAVDDYNTVSFEFELDHADILPLAGPVIVGVVDNPKLTTDVGAALGLPDVVGVVVTSGIYEGSNEEFNQITGYEIEGIALLEPAYYGGAEVVLTFADLVNVELGSAFDGADKSWLVGTFGTFGPVSAEVYYACLDDALADGQLIVDALFSQELGILDLDASAGFLYDLEIEDGDIAKQWIYSVAVVATADVGISVGGGVGVIGNSVKDHILEAVGIDLSVDPLEDLGIDVGIFLNTYTKPSGDDTPMLDHIDFSVYKNIGAAEYRIGYLYAGDEPAKYAAGTGTKNLKAPMGATAIDGGGAYIVVDIDY